MATWMRLTASINYVVDETPSHGIALPVVEYTVLAEDNSGAPAMVELVTDAVTRDTYANDPRFVILTEEEME